MISDDDAERALEFLKVSAKAYAKAKAERIYLEGFLEIDGYPQYQINESGVVVRVARSCGAVVGKKLRWTIMSNGYAKVSLCASSIRKEFLVHRLVAMTFIGNPEKNDVCHCDGNKLNNHVSNLRIDTRKGNMADQIRFGKTPRGEKCGSNKYKTEFVIRLRERLDSGESVSSIHNETGIPRPTLYGIKSRQTWGWL